MTIQDIYQTASQRGLAQSKRQFSTAYLGCAPNYLADAGWERCSTRVILHLYRRLGEEGQADLQALAFQRLLAAEAQDGGALAVGA
ncbi:hypothetical protein GCM10011504_25040 [Siccirubricoccus deserti]|uniref:Uncharacterized protein n=1 Tax=Siccirubricoccus deserti TaxID=2013562 RepID=A0A9X0R3S3_9PROT|nr:hypothetical protein [Siccirubricoccus deserti]MBC4019184.1 hypothetical protein [Siccirubricoccus deserti]GGC45535.1 hypothetical protein GCM10011504_25040 [Siccirubricoccus deserti]